MTCTKPDCPICASTKRREARPRMTKAQLLADVEACENAYMDTAEVLSMTEAYMAQLEAHLKVHRCKHDLGDLP